MAKSSKSLSKEQTSIIVAQLQAGTLSKKEIANLNNMKIGNVIKIANQNKELIHQALIQESKELASKKPVEVAEEVEEEIPAIVEEKVKDDVSVIIDLLSEGRSVAEIVKTMNTTSYRVNKIKKDLGLVQPRVKKETVVEEVPEPEPVVVPKKKSQISMIQERKIGNPSPVSVEKKPDPTEPGWMKVVPVIEGAVNANDLQSSVKVGLIAERHNMPVKDYIFEADYFDIHGFDDFEDQERICREFITKNIPFKDGKPQRELIVYLSGLQMPLCSLVHVCTEMKTNLVAMHHNPNGGFERQEVISCFDQDVEAPLIDRIIEKYNSTYLYKTNMRDLSDGTIYKAELLFYREKSSGLRGDDVVYARVIYLTKEESNGWELFTDLAKYIHQHDEVKMGLRFYDGNLTPGGAFFSGVELSKAHNFDTAKYWKE